MLGVHIGGTNCVAVFKDRFKEIAARDNLRVARFAEQAVIVHELGHAIGLVNNGLSMHEEHQDSGHGAHCQQDDCIMYYQNEAKEDLRKFILDYILLNDDDLFGSKCLEDAHRAL